MLLAGLPRAVRPAVPEQGPFRSLAVDRLGRWPLLINLIAAELALRIQEGDTLTQALDLINQGLDEVGLLAFEPLDTPERPRALGRAHHPGQSEALARGPP